MVPNKRASKQNYHSLTNLLFPLSENLIDYVGDVSKSTTSTVLAQQAPIAYLPHSKNVPDSFFIQLVDKSQLIQIINSIRVLKVFL